MTTRTLRGASHSPAMTAEGEQLVAEIERFLATRPARRPAVPAPAPARVSGSDIELPPVDELIAQAGIVTGPAPRTKKPPKTNDRELPGGLWRMLPDWALTARRGRRREVTVTEHLQLTALVIQRYGWCGRGLRSRSGRRCILGAQAVLYRLGYGSQDTAMAAGRVMDRILAGRGIRAHYWEWNDHPGRDEADVLHLLREAIDTAGAGR
ncbi:DUF6197 family protein [Streptomyces malaysiensis]|uniref:Uncharacterized protein n=1 Tax=Streptomyces malaysiensis TaxID=92644 RepID=A0A2J7Z9S8_STRMQ|nr:hypothetical protein [Streptomyces malaysiensis]PNG97026.1 hypothetical protein SMF913_13051 [Streptomyces malaysiensis]